MSYLRYSKHIELKGFGENGQERVTQSKVVIIGLGGLGSPSLQYIAGAGVGNIVICDDDAISLDNLHRQTIYTEENIGSKKTSCAKSYIEKMNSKINVEVTEEAVDVENIEDLVRGCDLVLDCTDNFRARYLINDACYLNSIPLITGAVTYTGGYVIFFNFGKNYSKEKPCYRCLYSKIQNSEKIIPTCSDSSVLGPSAGVIGCFMASEAVKYLSGYHFDDATKIINLDMKFNQFSTLQVDRNENCVLCSAKSKIKKIEDKNYEKTWRQTCQIPS